MQNLYKSLKIILLILFFYLVSVFPQDLKDLMLKLKITGDNLAGKEVNLATDRIKFEKLTGRELAEAYGMRGAALSELGKNEKALTDLNEAVKIDPQYAEAFSERGLVFWRLDSLEKALSDQEYAIRLKPDYAEAYSRMGGIKTQLGKKEEGLKDLNKGIQLNPNSFITYYFRGLAHYWINEFEKAINDFSYAIQIAPEYWGSYFQRSKVYHSSGEYKKAIQDFSDANRCNRGYYDIFFQMAFSFCLLAESDTSKYGIRENYRRATTWFGVVASNFNKDFAPAYYYTGLMIYKRLMIGDKIAEWDQAITDIEKAIALDPENEEYAITLKEIQTNHKSKNDKNYNSGKNGPPFSADGLHFEEVLTNFFRGNFLNIPFERREMVFSLLFGQYIRAYSSLCSDCLPKNKIQLTEQVCVEEEITRNRLGVELNRICVKYETRLTEFYASPEMYEAKSVIDRLKGVNFFSHLHKMLTLTPEKAWGLAGDIQGVATDMTALIQMNGCKSPGLMRFQENLRLFALNKQPIRMVENKTKKLFFMIRIKTLKN